MQFLVQVIDRAAFRKNKTKQNKKHVGDLRIGGLPRKALNAQTTFHKLQQLHPTDQPEFDDISANNASSVLSIMHFGSRSM
jgi:hypothetical protein